MKFGHDLANSTEQPQGQLDGFGSYAQYRGAAEKFIERTQKGDVRRTEGGPMKTVTCVAAAALVLLAPQMAQTNTKSTLPGKVLAARTIYVENRTSNAEIQNTVYLELAKWGRFQIVDSPKKADLVLRLSGANMVTFVPAGEKTYIYDPSTNGRSVSMEEPLPGDLTYLTLIDTKTGGTLWTEQRKTRGAQAKQKIIDGLREAIDLQEKLRAR